jgi:GTP diphosphokinase / guanosine-3',5'-bis(diphosphate) 3'-diphosphatase
MHAADPIVAAMRAPSAEDRATIRHAYDVAERVHGSELRKSGDPYITHPYAIALSLAGLGMDRDTIVAGILHDTIEDTPYTADELEREFGPTVRFLVESVTKLSKLKYQGLTRHVESLRRLLVATAADVRVIIIKLADRLHNMETLEHIEERKRKRIADETLEIYVPIAERLGMGYFKSQLQDLAFKVVDPKGYADAERYLTEKRHEMEEQLDEAVKDIKKELAENKIIQFQTEARIKGMASFAVKLKKKHGKVERVYDLCAIRILVPTVEDCYRVLGVVHNTWRPLAGRVKDYIAYPKPNGYQSIHTAVKTPRGLVVEIQIRTPEMHRHSQFGIASHLAYKAGEVQPDRAHAEWIRRTMPNLMKIKPHGAPKWLRDLTDALAETETESFKEALKQDFFAERIFTFTPKNDAIDLPLGATPVDFAYAVHSDLGDSAVGAIVNSKLVPLDTKLKNGDHVEIKTKKGGRPNRKWLEFVKTAGARKHIRSGTPRTKRSAK